MHYASLVTCACDSLAAVLLSEMLYKPWIAGSITCTGHGRGHRPRCDVTLLPRHGEFMYLLRLAGLLGLLGSGAFAALEKRPRAFFGSGSSSTLGAAGSSCVFSAAALPLPCKGPVCQWVTRSSS